MNQERKRILEMVQEGKLSAEEAIILLDALDKGNRDNAEEKPDAVGESGAASVFTADDKQKAGNGRTGGTKTDEDNFYKQMEQAGERIFDFVNNALRKIREIDFQFNQSVEIPHVFQQSGEEIERVDIDVANGPVRVIPWEQDEVRVECQAKVYRAEDREHARSYFLDNTIFSQDNSMLIFATKSKWMRVETVVHIPKKRYKKISVRIFTGEMTGERLECDHLLVKTTNGKVELESVSGSKLDMETVNGQIKVQDVRADELEAETINGAIDVFAACRKAELKSFNGNIFCKLKDAGTKVVEAKAVTGNIHLHVPDGAGINGELRSNLGSYSLDLEGVDILHEKRDVIQKQMKFKRTGTGEETIHVLADTKTGAVSVKSASKKEE
jgi:DUF4097 and DUF4098 domain-containing protein YvlB